MVKELAISEVTPTAPVDASVTYMKDEAEIHVPVYAMPPDGVFAPPVLVPAGTWTVVWKTQPNLEHPDLGFESIVFDDSVPGLQVEQVPGAVGFPIRRTTLTNTVSSANRVHCTITLTSSTEEEVALRFSGDPTIAVVSDPLG